jgi:DNA modification methylase
MVDIKDNTELVKPENLIPYANNPKEHPEKQVDKIASSIKNYGFVQPIVTDADNEVIIGHGRLEAAKKLGLEQVPVIKNADLTESEAKALRLADNRIAESGMDDEAVAVELEQLTETDDFEELVTGYDEDEMSMYLDKISDDESLVEEVEPGDKDDIDTDINKGDIFELGGHRLMCGNGLDDGAVKELMDGDKANMVFTDPPYNVDYGDGKNPQGLSKRDKIENDKQTEEEWIKFNRRIRNTIKRFSHEKCDSYICSAPGPDGIKQRNRWIEDGFHWSSTIIWVKDQFVFSRSNYHRRYEPILYGWFGKSSYNGDDTDDEVWEIDRPQHSEEHPTMKPLKIMSRAIRNSSTHGDIVLDIFGGSGSTLLAAEQTDRRCYMMELEPEYCQVVINRWEELTGETAKKLEAVEA